MNVLAINGSLRKKWNAGTLLEKAYELGDLLSRLIRRNKWK
jgi:hypothetical protein